ncbi:MAG: ammonium transporter [Deltaproteobacteria bacterium]|nr:ammonium transporter [Deltaproteobacteria bacterium]
MAEEAVPQVKAATEAATAPAAPVPPKIDTGDTAWVLISTALVMLMTPGLALFYGGMVRKKNVLGTIMQSFIIIAIISIQWVLWGYTLAFGPDKGGIIGGLEWLGLNGVGLDPNPDYAATIPHQATLVYDPVCHWVWAVGGWIRNIGALDFAGGTVVHISSGVSALAAALLIGKRKGYMTEIMAPHNLPMTVLGAGLLWFGWFGFNAGSAVASGALATSAFVVTNTATAAAALAWIFAEWIQRGKPTVLGAASGAVAGLVAITPASGFVGPMSSIVIGLGAGIICYTAVSLIKPLLGYDDSLDAFGVHGVGGTWGAIATGLFATTTINSAGADGLFFGNPALLGKQIIAVLVTMTYAFVVTFVLLKVLDWTMGLRASEEEEVMGLDLTQHGENGYSS